MGYKRKTRMTRKNIKVPEPLFLALRDDKDDTQSWPHYLETECLHDDAPAVELPETVDARIVDMDAAERRQFAEEVAEVLQG